MNPKHMMLVASALITLDAVASGASPSTAADVPASALVLSVSFTNIVQFGDPRAIEVMVTYSNRSDAAIQIDMGSLRAEFVEKEYTDMFDQIVMAMPAKEFATVTLDPSKEFTDRLILVPQRGSTVPPGEYRAQIYSHLRHGSTISVDAGAVIFEIK